jgi:hypothetical protein
MSVNTCPDNLLPKFRPFLLGNQECTAECKAEIDQIFSSRSTSDKIKDYIIDAGNWILKLERSDALPTTHDTHLYRVRKAERYRNFIQENGYENDLMVPKKYLYWHEIQQKFYTVSEKVDLSDEVAKPDPEFGRQISVASRYQLEDQMAQMGLDFSKTQTGALKFGKQQRAITPTQAKALAELCLQGYTDLSYNNIFFTQDGKIAIIDTEPVKRAVKKTFDESYFSMILGEKRITLCSQKILGFKKLKLACSDEAAIKEVEKVETNHVLWNIAIQVTKIAITCLALYVVPTALALLPIGAAAAGALILAFKIATCTKLVFLGTQLAYTMANWAMSRGGVNWVAPLAIEEATGIF